MILGQEPQGPVVFQPAVLDMIGVDPRGVVQAVLTYEPFVAEVHRGQPAVLVVHRSQVNRDATAVRRPARFPDDERSLGRRLEALRGFLTILALRHKILHGGAPYIGERIVLESGEIVESQRMFFTAGKVDQPQGLWRGPFAADARAHFTRLDIATLRDVIRHRAGFAFVKGLFARHDKQPAAFGRQGMPCKFQVIAEINGRGGQAVVHGIQGFLAFARRIFFLFGLAQLLVKAFLVRLHDVEVLVCIRIFLETDVGHLLGKPRRGVEHEKLLAALEGDATTICHEERIRLGCRCSRYLPERITVAHVDIAGIDPGMQIAFLAPGRRTVEQ